MNAPSMRPTAGVRYAIERAGEEEATTVYRGFAHLPDKDLPLEVRVDEGNVTAKILFDDGAALGPAELRPKPQAEGVAVDVADLAKNATALVKAAVRGARDGGRALPRRIVRWRG